MPRPTVSRSQGRKTKRQPLSRKSKRHHHRYAWGPQTDMNTKSVKWKERKRKKKTLCPRADAQMAATRQTDFPPGPLAPFLVVFFFFWFLVIFFSSFDVRLALTLGHHRPSIVSQLVAPSIKWEADNSGTKPHDLHHRGPHSRPITRPHPLDSVTTCSRHPPSR